MSGSRDGAPPTARLERRFVWIAGAFGLAFALLLPPLTTPDEGRHFARIYTLTEGSLFVPGPEATVPASLGRLDRKARRAWPTGRSRERESVGFAIGLWRVPLAPAVRVGVRNLTHYGPVAYAPQALGVWLGRLLELPVAGLVVLGRIANLAAWIGLVAWALRVAPVRRHALYLLALLPMSVYLGAALAADAMTAGLALLLVALVLRTALGDGPVRGREIALLCGVALALSLTKLGYWLLACVVFAIPIPRLGSKRRWLAVSLGVTACSVVPSVVWFLSSGALAFASPVPGVDPGGQLAGVLASPGHLVEAYTSTLTVMAWDYARTFVGVLGYLDVVLPAPVYAACGTSLLAAALVGPPDPPAWTGMRRVLALAVAAASLFLLLGIFFLVATPVGATVIRGVQGRYLLPLAPLVLAACPALGRAPLLDRARFWTWFPIATLAIALWAALGRYYAL